MQFVMVALTEMLTAGNFRNWLSAAGKVPWSSVPKRPMNSVCEPYFGACASCLHSVKLIRGEKRALALHI